LKQNIYPVLFDRDFEPELDQIIYQFLRAFKLGKIESQNCLRRAEFNLRLVDPNEKEKGINDVEITSDDSYTMQEILLTHGKSTHWQNLYNKFKVRNQGVWLDEIKETIENIKNDLPIMEVMTPFNSHKNIRHLPILTRIEKKAYEKNKLSYFFPLNISVGFIPWPNIEEKCDSLNFISDESTMMVKPIFSPVKEGTNPEIVFTLMPFTKEKNLQEVYENYMKKIVESFGLNCVRADDIFEHNMVMEDIWEHICKTRFIISDLTDKNPNVFYELGMAHTVGKRVILLTQNHQDVPFDLRHMRYIKYEFTPPGMERLKLELGKAIESLLKTT
jgi:hypothetical protein